MADAGRRVQHRHRRVLLQSVLQPLAAARDDEVHEPVLRRELTQLVAVAAGHDRDGALRDAGPLDRPGSHLSQHGIRVRRGRRTAQHDRVPRLQRQRGAVNGHVRACLVYHRHDPERHAHAPHVEAVLEPVAVDRLAHRIGQGGDRPHVPRDPRAAAPPSASAGRAARTGARRPRRPPCRAHSPRGSRASAGRGRRPSPRARRSSSPCRGRRARATRPSPARRPQLPTEPLWPCRQGIGRACDDLKREAPQRAPSAGCETATRT